MQEVEVNPKPNSECRPHAYIKENLNWNRVIIIVDGIDNLRAEDGSERLAWLPNNIPTGRCMLVQKK